jgi:uncharacterized beta-barrel protein YwiB (DUF1934 family)
MTNEVIISVEGTQKFIGEEKQTVSIVTDGLMRMEGDKVYLSYEESEMTGMEGTTTTFEVGKDKVILHRTGAVESQMVFEKGKKDISLYNMGFGALTIGIKARRLRNELGPEGGRLEIGYSIEIEDQAQGLNSFIIDVRKPGATQQPAAQSLSAAQPEALERPATDHPMSATPQEPRRGSASLK